MSLVFLRSLLAQDDDLNLHLARLLILTSIILQKPDEKITGITKLVKLDFLLRYPVALERALQSIQKPIEVINIRQHERDNVEAKMVRFKYGPWDPRYRRFLAILQGKGLVRVTSVERTVEIKITAKGTFVAQKLVEKSEFEDYVNRSKIIKSNFSNLSAMRLKNLMYELIPELKEMDLGEIIAL